MAITPSGKAVPCQSWLSDDALGDFLTDSWEEIWNSEKCKERRDYSAKMEGKCPLRKGCGNCSEMGSLKEEDKEESSNE